MKTPYINLKLSLIQAKTISKMCETVARLHMGQMDVLQDIYPDLTRDECNDIKKICFPCHDSGAYRGIRSEKLSDDSRKLWDTYQVLRHHLVWREQENTPATRKFPEQIFVQYDSPMRTSQESELPEVEEVCKNE